MDNIAVLVATYNGEKYIEEQLKSLLKQTEQDFVCYVHDDGSKDETPRILENFALNNSHKIKILSYEKTGSSKANFFSMLKRVDAKYYMFCDQDDVWLPEKIEKTYSKIRKIEKEDKPCAVFTDLCVVDKELNIINKSYMDFSHRDPKKTGLRELLVRNVAAGCTMMINRSLRDLAITYTDENSIFMHDVWCLLIGSVLGDVAYIDEATLLYRQHGDNQVGAKRGSIKWVSEKLSNLFSGKQLAESKKGIVYQRSTALELLRFDGIGNEDRAFLTELANIGSQKKSVRIRFYTENHLIMNDWKNKWKKLIV